MGPGGERGRAGPSRRVGRGSQVAQAAPWARLSMSPCGLATWLRGASSEEAVWAGVGSELRLTLCEHGREEWKGPEGGSGLQARTPWPVHNQRSSQPQTKASCAAKSSPADAAGPCSKSCGLVPLCSLDAPGLPGPFTRGQMDACCLPARRATGAPLVTGPRAAIGCGPCDGGGLALAWEGDGRGNASSRLTSFLVPWSRR